ncbi:hypothetical protein AAFF_G00375220 [Aldrovandia affinis]|uniref:Uncharacterized protein n=1 Tax=Aldrovandia affinis TaxID=143900 RepID=A0AAD7SG52_9TELE|nr:hypothetical protein AAFF_G00375220 [Aldrovandia affinis]
MAGLWTVERKLHVSFCPLTDDAWRAWRRWARSSRETMELLWGRYRGASVDVTTRASWSQSYVTGTDGPVSPFVHWQLTLRHSQGELRPYAPAVLSEYARDQFVRAIEPRDLRERVQLRHPSTLQEALELALEREELRGETTQGEMREVSPTVRVAVESSPAREQPEWVGAMMERMTELVRAVTLHPQGGAARSPGPMRCWGVAGPAIASGTAAIARRSRETAGGPSRRGGTDPWRHVPC